MITDTTERPDTATAKIEIRLDELQNNLPTVPAKWLELNRAVAKRTMSANRRNYEVFSEAVETVAKSADTGIRTVLGTARWTTERAMSVAATGVRTVVGQTRAQTEIVVETTVDEIEDLADEAIDRVEAADTRAEKHHLRSKTRAELYAQAKELDIEGRASMNKSQLVAAIAAV